MKEKLDKAIRTYASKSGRETEQVSLHDPRALLIVTILYLATLLSMPLDELSGLIWFGIYPIIASAITGQSYTSIFLKSLIVLPFVLLIGIFNPILDHSEGMTIGTYQLNHGWLTFISISLRALFSVQALLILTSECGFTGMCRALKKMLVPGFITTQLEMVYRYCGVLMQEVQQMKRARAARGYGRKTMRLKEWGPLIGQLFLRSIDRAQRVHQAMLCRGFSGVIPYYEENPRSWSINDTLYLAGWSLTFLLLRLYNPTMFFH